MLIYPQMWQIFIVFVFILLVSFYLYYRRRLPYCVNLHSPNGQNYPWLKNIHGGLKKIMFEEPANSGKWRDYNDKIWAIHCKVVDHSPDKLVDSHLRAFVNPDTRFARLMFYFNDGTQMEPTREFYELEANWFKK